MVLFDAFRTSPRSLTVWYRALMGTMRLFDVPRAAAGCGRPADAQRVG